MLMPMNFIKAYIIFVFLTTWNRAPAWRTNENSSLVDPKKQNKTKKKHTKKRSVWKTIDKLYFWHRYCKQR